MEGSICMPEIRLDVPAGWKGLHGTNGNGDVPAVMLDIPK